MGNIDLLLILALYAEFLNFRLICLHMFFVSELVLTIKRVKRTICLINHVMKFLRSSISHQVGSDPKPQSQTH